MKKVFIFIASIFLGMEIFATPLIDAAKKQDYKTFEKLVKNNSPLDEVNESGMNVQLSLAYFKPVDFKKACNLLEKRGFDFDVPVENNISLLYILAYSCSYEKIAILLKYNIDVNRKNSATGLKPIDATQFSTFKFYSEQNIKESAYKRAERTREILLQNGSEDFTYATLTMKNFGNFFFCMYNIIASFFPYTHPSLIDSAELYDFYEVDGQSQGTLREDKMKELFEILEFEVEINNYYDSNTIVEKLKETELSEDMYALIGATGNNPIAPFQWIGIQNVQNSENLTPDNYLNVSNSDSLYDFVDFQVKDLSQLVTIKLKY